MTTIGSPVEMATDTVGHDEEDGVEWREGNKKMVQVPKKQLWMSWHKQRLSSWNMPNFRTELGMYRTEHYNFKPE